MRVFAALGKEHGRGWDAGVVAGLLLLATGVNFLFDEHLSLTSQAMVYVLAVVIASYTTRLAASLACAVAAAVLLNLFLAHPGGAVDATHDVVALAAMLAVALVIGRRGAALRRETQLARVNEARARLLQELATALAAVGSRGDVEAIGERFVAQARQDGELGEAIAVQVRQALARLALAGSVQEAQEVARWHRAQSTFLAGLSHDIRTPLAAMATAASSLQEQRHKLGPAEQQRLTRVILEEAARLAVLTENTLQLARLENAGEIHRDWQSIEEIVGSVLARLRGRDARVRILSKVPAQLPLIQGDPVLLAQLLDNLLDNALKYSEGPVELAVQAGAGWIELAVHDAGPGIAPGEEESVFAPFRRNDRSGQRGPGVGLAVCRAIARAHGTDIVFQRREGGGSSFVLRLPVEPVQLSAEAA